MLDFSLQLFRAAQQMPAETFQDKALAALGTHLHFEAAVWFAGELGGGEFHFHRLHAWRLPPEAQKQVIEVYRRSPRPVEMTAASPGIPHVFDALQVYSEPGSTAALEYARRWRVERQLLIAHADGETASGEWLSLHRPQSQEPFSDRDRAVVRQVMPHLSEARAVNRALSLGRASTEPFFARSSHRALTLLDGTVLHCGRKVSDSIGAEWPDWSGLCLPAPLLRDLTASGSARIVPRGESILARQFSDSLVLTVKSLPLAERLNRRELAVAQLFGAGRPYREIASRCRLSPDTVRSVVRQCYRKLNINSRAQLARLISQMGTGAPAV